MDCFVIRGFGEKKDSGGKLIDFDKVDKTRGMDVTIVTTAKTDEEASEFLVAMGLPLQKPAGAAQGDLRASQPER